MTDSALIGVMSQLIIGEHRRLCTIAPTKLCFGIVLLRIAGSICTGACPVEWSPSLAPWAYEVTKEPKTPGEGWDLKM